MNKLALGTVQFGLDYGINNSNGQVEFNEVNKILNLLKLNKIDTIDTASSYGNSEKILGKIGISNLNVITKTLPLTFGVNNVIKTFYQSLENLKVPAIDGLLIHNFSDAKHEEFDILYKELCILKDHKVINKIGFSIYSPMQANFLLNNFDFDLIQAPLNVFDVRLINSGILGKLKSNKIEVHARSVFLQGLLLNFKELDEYFFRWKNKFNEYQKIVESSNLSLLEYALNFVLNIKDIDKVIVGVNSERQLKEIIQTKIDKDVLDGFPINDLKLLNPSEWKT
jgi:aryl-alcohol dehydrogenase-like predicted oxidoreductase